MKIAAILASPTGAKSATLHYVQYLQRRFAEHEFELLDVGRGTRRLERDLDRFNNVVAAMKAADAVLWTFPVYTFLAPAGLVRFVELLYERAGEGAFADKPATVLTTSEHFFDHTAHTYMEEVAEDLGMGVFRGFSAEMEEIFGEEGRRNLEGWMGQFIGFVEDGVPPEIHHTRVRWDPPGYEPMLGEPVARTGRRSVTVITDVTEDDTDLSHMIETFVHHCPHPVDVLNLHDIGMKGGCMGCLRCVYDGSCVYKDGFASAFDERIRTADVLVFAATVRHRYFSATCKAYFDRNFRNGHRPILHGKPMGWLISGPLRQLPNLRQIIEAKAEVQRSPMLTIVTDEYGHSDAITARIEHMAASIEGRCAEAWIRPATFLGVGGRKIFRDLMWAMRGIMRADHAYYTREGLYDFPTRGWRSRLFNWAMTAMMVVPWSRKWLLKNIAELKLARFEKLLEATPDTGGP